jgi:hypothetical protein
MLNAAARLDRLLAFSRPLWLWLGQAGVVLLGVHLAADRLDDWLVGALQRAPWAWPGVDWPLVIGGWGAVALELAVAVKLLDALILTPRQPPLSASAWWSARSVEAALLTALWAVCGLAGAWSVGMAVEDRLAGGARALSLPLAAQLVGAAAALLVAWRLGWTGWRRVVGGLNPAPRRLKGLGWAPLLLPVIWTAGRYGLPIFGWLT